jgi:hypothetical protein
MWYWFDCVNIEIQIKLKFALTYFEVPHSICLDARAVHMETCNPCRQTRLLHFKSQTSRLNPRPLCSKNEAFDANFDTRSVHPRPLCSKNEAFDANFDTGSVHPRPRVQQEWGIRRKLWHRVCSPSARCSKNEAFDANFDTGSVHPRLGAWLRILYIKLDISELLTHVMELRQYANANAINVTPTLTNPHPTTINQVVTIYKSLLWSFYM